MLELFQISSALPRSLFIADNHVQDSRCLCLTGVPYFEIITNACSVRYGLMFSRWLAAAGVTLVLRPMFAPVAATLIPGKERWPFSRVETRRPLSSVGTTSSKDISSRSLNLWESLLQFLLYSTSSVEVTVQSYEQCHLSLRYYQFPPSGTPRLK